MPNDEDSPSVPDGRRRESELTARLRSVGILRPYESQEEIDSYAQVDRSARLVATLFCLLPVAAAVGGAIVAAVPLETLKTWADGLAPDGTATTFPPGRLANVQTRVLVASFGWLCLGLLGFYMRYRFPGPLRNGMREIIGFGGWLARRLRGLTPVDRVHAFAVVAMTLVASFAAALALDQAVRTDEASTYVNYVSKPPLYIVAVYSKTNNHVFHNLLAWVSVNMFGDGLVQLRIPTFLAGTLLLPATYIAARRHQGRHAALLALALLASSVAVLDASTNARGYQMLILAFVVMLVTLPSLVRGEQWAWLVFVLTISLGFWLVPVMAYPAVIGGVWLCIACVRDGPRNPRTFLVRIAIAVASIGVTVGALYSPAQVVSQVTQVVSEQSKWGAKPTFLGALADSQWRIEQLLEHWRYARPSAVHWLLLGGLFASPFLAHRTSRYGARLLWSTLVAMVAVVAVTKVYPPFWSLGFLYPVCVLLASAGIAGALSFLPWERARSGLPIALALVVFGVSIPPAFDRETMEEVPWYVGYPDAEQLVEEIAEPLLEGARLDASFVNGATINYYLWRHDPRLFYGDRTTNLEDDPETVFLAVPPESAGPDADRRRGILAERGYRELPERRRAGETEIITFRRAP